MMNVQFRVPKLFLLREHWTLAAVLCQFFLKMRVGRLEFTDGLMKHNLLS